MTTKEIPIAVMGIGKIARDQHLPSISRSPVFQLAAAVSRNARIEGIENFPHLAALLKARSDVPAIALCMPPQVRFEAARMALEADKHVLMEKPPGATVAEVMTLRDIAAEKGLTLFATWHSRFAAAVQPAKVWLAERQIRRLQVIWKEDVRRWHPGQAWIWDAGGAGVFDPGINALSILTEILPQAIHLTGAELLFPTNRDTPIAANLRFAGIAGAEISAEFDWRQTGQQSWDITVETDSGKLDLNAGGSDMTVDGKTVIVEPQREYDGIYSRFAELLDKGISEVDTSPLVHVADALMLGKRIVTGPFSE